MHLILALILLIASTTASKRFCDTALYFSLGAALKTASIAGQIGWAVSKITPCSPQLGKECLLFSMQSSVVAHHLFAQILKESTLSPSSPLTSWQKNKTSLDHVPAITDGEKQLVLFLENRWLAKSTGFFTSVIDCFFPCFKLSLQIHPETKSSYARNPGIGFSKTYAQCIEEWKQSLFHPHHFPLILTRPCSVTEYLPSPSKRTLLDFTNLSTEEREALLQKEKGTDKSQIICFERVLQKHVGGMRILPLKEHTPEDTKAHDRFLLEWVSLFGLTANRVELDRCLHQNRERKKTPVSASLHNETKKSLLSHCATFEADWHSNHAAKTMMVSGTIAVLEGLLHGIEEEKNLSPAQQQIADLSFSKIKDQLEILKQEKDETPFFDTVTHLEEIHGYISSLLEVYSPFAPEQFSAIYLDALNHLPAPLKKMTQCAVHASGMTSIAGIFKAVEKSIGKQPRVIFGENTYFECIKAAEHISQAAITDLATEEDWKEVDLILAQFNPALKRIDFPVSPYKVENIAEVLHRTLTVRNGKPLTVAIDCTIDYIDSPRLTELLEEFQGEIAAGVLNFTCYRSGLKFDLFGMDNYSGAPFFMIHNGDPEWTSFDLLLTDPALLTERLSSNWFCLAYKCAAPYLEQYRKLIFDNTRALLSKIPKRLLRTDTDYRVISAQQEGDLCFLDIKVFGPLHQQRCAALVGGCLTIGSLTNNQPMFYRPTIGLYHPNLIMLFGKDCSTIRLTLGLDPAQVDVLAHCFTTIDSLN